MSQTQQKIIYLVVIKTATYLQHQLKNKTTTEQLSTSQKNKEKQVQSKDAFSKSATKQERARQIFQKVKRTPNSGYKSLKDTQTARNSLEKQSRFRNVMVFEKIWKEQCSDIMKETNNTKDRYHYATY